MESWYVGARATRKKCDRRCMKSWWYSLSTSVSYEYGSHAWEVSGNPWFGQEE